MTLDSRPRDSRPSPAIRAGNSRSPAAGPEIAVPRNGPNPGNRLVTDRGSRLDDSAFRQGKTPKGRTPKVKDAWTNLSPRLPRSWRAFAGFDFTGISGVEVIPAGRMCAAQGPDAQGPDAQDIGGCRAAVSARFWWSAARLAGGNGMQLALSTRSGRSAPAVSPSRQRIIVAHPLYWDRQSVRQRRERYIRRQERGGNSSWPILRRSGRTGRVVERAAQRVADDAIEVHAPALA